MYSGYTQDLAEGYSLRVEHWRIADADPARQQVRAWLVLDGADLQYQTVTIAADATDAEALAAIAAVLAAAAEAHTEQALLAGLEGVVL
jgi:hypothetical protein